MSPLLTAIGLDLWRATWQGGIFVVAVLILCKVFRGLPAASRYWLWWLACLQFPIRLLFFSPVALPLLPEVKPIDAAMSTQARQGGTSDSAAAEVADPEISAGINLPSAAPDWDGAVERYALATQLAAQTNDPVSAGTVLMFGWGVGVVTVLVLASRRLIRTRRMMRESRPVGGEAESVVRELSTELRIRPPFLRQAESAPCPLLAGWVRPTIVLPAGFVMERNSADLRMAIAHELVHLKRRDLWLAGVPLAAQSLFFFHPLSWLAARESAAACEEACDVEAMRLSGGSPSAYARLLLSSAQSEVPIAAMGAAFGFRLLQRRITMLNQSTLLNKPGVRRGMTALIALAVVCSIPWTVTAQSPAVRTVPPMPPKKTDAHKKHVPRHHAAKKATKSSKYVVTRKGGKAVTISVAGRYPVGAPVNTPPPPASPFYRAVAAPSAPGASIGVTQAMPVPAMPPGPPRAPGSVPKVTPARPAIARTGAAPTAPGVGYGATAPALAPPPPRAGSTAPAFPPGSSGYAATGAAPVALPFPPGATTPARRGGNSQPVATASTLGQPLVASTGDGRVTIDMHKTSIVTALRALFKNANVNYSIKSTVEDSAITCSLTNVPLDVALHTILESARQDLTYRVEGGVYMILPK